MSPRTGRPTTNPKNADKVSVRLDKESSEILKRYCTEKNTDKGEAIRRGIKLLDKELK